MYHSFILFLNFRLQQCEEDKLTKDSQIRALKQELTAQEELFSKLQREKKAWADGRQQKARLLNRKGLFYTLDFQFNVPPGRIGRYQ